MLSGSIIILLGVLGAVVMVIAILFYQQRD